MESSFFRQPANGLYTGIVLGVAIITVLNVLNIRIGERTRLTQPILTSPASAQAFVSDWTRSSEGTWAVDSSFVRTLANGRRLNGSVMEAQRPPDHVRESFGSIDATLNGRRYVCGALSTTDTPTCRDTGAADFQAQAVKDLAAVKAEVLGVRARYDVQLLGNHCYRLYQRPSLQTAPFGSQATLCYDPTTGAPVRNESVHDGATDVVAGTVRAPTDPDFALPKR